MGPEPRGVQKEVSFAMNVVDFIDRYRYREFKYGVTDCCLFVADYVHELTGVDHAAQWRGTYNTPEGAKSIIDENGGYESMFDAALPGCRVDAGNSVTGDIVLYMFYDHVTAGIRVGQWCATPAKTGMSLVPCGSVFAAWRVN